MDCAGDLLKFTCKWILDNCPDDLKFVSKRIDKAVVDRLQSFVSSSFEKISYADAVEKLKQVIFTTWFLFKLLTTVNSRPFTLILYASFF